MKLMQRRATIAVALALGGASAPSVTDAQSNRGLPGADTPRLLVAVFQSRDKAAGVQVADAIRTRLTSSSNPRQLYIIPREQMVSFLESSGYKADSSLGLTDLKELAKGLRADEIIGGTVSGAAGNYKFEPRLMLASDPAIAQPLPPFETGNFADAGRQIERSAQDARKQLPDHKACQNHIRASAIDKAILAANAGILKYPNATISRLCLANSFQAAKQWDSVLKVTDDIKRIDPRNALSSVFEVRALKEKADQETDPVKKEQYREASVRALVRLLSTDPGNPTLQNAVITELGQLGKPSTALPIIDELLHANPGDPTFLRQKWFLSLQAGQSADSASKPAQFAKAIQVGEEMAKADSTLADSTYYDRQIRAATVASTQKAVEFASKAVQKWPTNQDFWWYKAGQERKAGQLQAAQMSTARLLTQNPKYPNATVMLGQLFLEQKMTDSAIALARRAVASGEDRKTWGAFLLTPTQGFVVAAQAVDRDSTAAKDGRGAAAWGAALQMAQEADRLSPQPLSKFFIGISSFQAGNIALNTAPKAPKRGAEMERACAQVKLAQDMFLLTQTNMPAGGSINPQTAGQLLGFVAQLTPAVDERVKLWCK